MNVLRHIPRLFLRLGITLVALVLLFTAAGIAVLNLYGDKIKDYSIRQLNERLEIEVHAGNIELSFFTKFPYLSLVLNEVYALPSDGFEKTQFRTLNPDTLLSAKTIYLQFHLPDILRGRYEIRRIIASGGYVNLLTDNAGQINYAFLKETENSAAEEAKGFNLHLVRFNDIKVNYFNHVIKFYTSAILSDVSFKGRFSKDSYSMGTAGNLTILELRREEISFLRAVDLNARLVMEVTDGLTGIRKGELKFGNFSASVTGSIGTGEVTNLDLDIRTRNVDLQNLLSSLSEEQRNRLDINAYGRGDIALLIKGESSRFRMPSLQSAFMLNINRLEWDNHQVSNLELKGTYTNGRLREPSTSRVNLEAFRLRDRQSDLQGSLELNDFVRPDILLKLNGILNAEVINEFFQSQSIAQFKGTLQPTLVLSTRLESISDLKGKAFVSGSLTGTIGVENGGFLVPGLDPFSNINGNIVLDGDSWMPGLTLNLGKSHAQLRLKTENVLGYFLGNRPLWISGTMNAGRIDLEPFFAPGDTTPAETFMLPGRIFMQLEVTADSLTAGKFFGRNLSSMLNYKPGFLSASGLNMYMLGGTTTGNIALVQNADKKLSVRTQHSLSNIDITQLFHVFNNFNQDFITEKHLSGKISGEVDLATVFDTLLNIDQDQTTAQTDLIIREGELKDFEPAESLSKFIALEELQDIRFSELRNTFSIRNKKVFIPEMQINSSAFNLGISGFHGFDNYFEYKIKVSLSEILSRKAQSQKAENQEYFTEEKDTRRSSLFLSITGTPDDYKIRYDRKEASQQIKEDLRNEKNTLKNILNEEFGWFKKDSLEVKPDATQKEQKFIFEWGEGEKTDSTATKKKKTQKKEEKIQFEWDDG
jgi:hypothetical protein